MGKIGIVISREYLSRVKKKSFLLTTVVVPVLFAALMILPGLIMYYGKGDKVYKIAVADSTGILAANLESTRQITYVPIALEEAKNVKDGIKDDGEYYALLQISGLDADNNTKLTLYSYEQINIDVQDKVSSSVNEILRDHKLKSYGVPELEEILDNVQKKVKLKTVKTADDEKDEKETSVIAYMGVGYVSSFLIYMFIFMFGGAVMQGVIEEKNNRIIEIIISSIKPVQLMIGKIVGIAMVALTQFLIWILLTVLIITGVSSAIGMSGSESVREMVSAGNTSQVAAIAQNATGTDIIGTDIIDMDTESGESDFAETFRVVLNSLSEMNLPGVIATFLVYFIFGYLLYAGMFAAIGSCVDNQADTQQLMFPITIPLIAGLFIMLSAFQNPDSAIAVWGSIIPFTSPMVMVARFAYGVPAWQYILSVSLLILTFLAMAWISAKIYRIGILSYGKKASWKEIFKWLKFKD